MSTKAAALQSLLEELGIPVWTAAGVPDDCDMPYLTYNPVSNSFGSETTIEADLWCYGDGETQPNELVQRLSKIIGRGGRMVRCDGGAVWVRRGSPFAQEVPDWDEVMADNDKIKRRNILLDVEYITAD